MAPLLIDSRDLSKLALISVLVVALIFASGFFIGHQRAAVFYQAGSVVQSLDLPEQTAAAENVFESQLPEQVVAGEEIDVDLPEAIVKVNAAAQMPAELHVEKKSEHQSLTTVDKGSVLKSSGAEKNTSVDKLIVKQHGGLPAGSMVSAVASEPLRKIKYSIQVGTYGRLLNAENMMEMLQAQKFEAYITNSTNKKNEVRYNVRYGYFSTKKSAITSLEKFKSDQMGDSYLVRFSAADIIDIADAAVINQPVNIPVHNDQPDKEIKPAATPSEVAQDKISQADVLNNVNVRAN